MTEEERQELQKQVSELRVLVVQRFEQVNERENRLVNALTAIKAYTWDCKHGSGGSKAYIEASSILGELYPLKKVNTDV